MIPQRRVVVQDWALLQCTIHIVPENSHTPYTRAWKFQGKFLPLVVGGYRYHIRNLFLLVGRNIAREIPSFGGGGEREAMDIAGEISSFCGSFLWWGVGMFSGTTHCKINAIVTRNVHILDGLSTTQVEVLKMFK